MIKTLGVGWINKNKCGLRRKGLTYKYEDLKSLYFLLKGKGILNSPVENFSRFDQASKLTSLAVGLALYDAGIVYGQGKKREIGILAANRNGSLEAQAAYFKDYIDNGRILGRGNLFIYTLPSTPLAEAAIHFGLSGPLLYLNLFNNPKDTKLIEYAQEIITLGQAEKMLVLSFSDQKTTCFVLEAR